MIVMMVTLLCGWGPYSECMMMPPEYVTLEHCRQQQAVFRDVNDHVQIKCIKQANT